LIAIGFLMKNNMHKAPVRVERLRDTSVNIHERAES
jgi:hypothetical protein